MSSLLRTLTALSLSASLAACNNLPAGAPASSDIRTQAEAQNADFTVYNVTRSFLPRVATWPATGKQEHLKWIPASGGSNHQLIRVGDSLSIQIWDSSDSSVLAPADQKMARLQDIKVSPDGSIFVPYAGKVEVQGMTESKARELLQTELEEITPSPQVQLTMKEGRENSVELVAGVAAPGTYPILDRNYTLLNLLSAGGGARSDLPNPQIRLIRSGNIYGTSINKLLDNPKNDTGLRGGDKVFIKPDDRHFLSFGATGLQGRHVFTKDALSAMDAITTMGGLNDRKADPKGLLILREYDPIAIGSATGLEKTRAVFSIDLTSVDGLFSAGKFLINPDDLIMATESPINDANTVANLVGNMLGVAMTGTRITN